jgi:NADPH:quinone reductase-like Zn-dependent oxidoreductase
VFDDVWQQFARLASPSRGSMAGSLGYSSPAEEFSSPAATNTTVLVAGATGRVGRILVRKLLLRGYKVKHVGGLSIGASVMSCEIRVQSAAADT